MKSTEYIASKLKISFDGIEVLSKDWGWKMLADVEGRLTVTIEGKVFFNEEGILILEFALALMRWIKKIESGNITSFYYESMDYEDKPILAFIHSDASWELCSVWQLFANESELYLEDILNISKKYVVEVLEYLKTNYKFDFLLFIQSEKT